jgi:hypothetical protein
MPLLDSLQYVNACYSRLVGKLGPVMGMPDDSMVGNSQTGWPSVLCHLDNPTSVACSFPSVVPPRRLRSMYPGGIQAQISIEMSVPFEIFLECVWRASERGQAGVCLSSFDNNRSKVSPNAVLTERLAIPSSNIAYLDVPDDVLQLCVNCETGSATGATSFTPTPVPAPVPSRNACAMSGVALT